MVTGPHDEEISELNEQAIEWQVRLRSDEVRDDEMEAFAHWLVEDPRHSEAFASAENLFDDMVMAARQAPKTVPLQVISNQNQNENTPRASTKTQSGSTAHSSPLVRMRRWLPAAAAMAAAWLFTVNLVAPENAHPLAAFLSDYHTATGSMQEVELADGSKVLLNTNSAISVDYDDSKRHIVLHHGQARFTVAQDQQRPFEVEVDGLRVMALGTVFDIYRTEQQHVYVTVQEHAVGIDFAQPSTSDSPNSQLRLTEGHRVHYQSGDTGFDSQAVDLRQALAWQQGRLVLSDYRLADLVGELNRYRLGRIYLADDQLKDLRVTGVFSLQQPDDILQSVSEVLGLQQTRLTPWWVLLHR